MKPRDICSYWDPFCVELVLYHDQVTAVPFYQKSPDFNPPNLQFYLIQTSRCSLPFAHLCLLIFGYRVTSMFKNVRFQENICMTHSKLKIRLMKAEVEQQLLDSVSVGEIWWC